MNTRLRKVSAHQDGINERCFYFPVVFRYDSLLIFLYHMSRMGQGNRRESPTLILYGKACKESCLFDFVDPSPYSLGSK